jgi:transcriptional regulator with XRE-family HTH domain
VIDYIKERKILFGGIVETIRDRIKLLRKYLDMTQQEFADKLGLKTGNTFSMIERGESAVTEQNIILICSPNRLKNNSTVNEDWLRNGGDLPMFEPQDSGELIFDKDGRRLPQDECEIVGIFKQLTPPNKKQAKIQINATLEVQKASMAEAADMAEKTMKR